MYRVTVTVRIVSIMKGKSKYYQLVKRMKIAKILILWNGKLEAKKRFI